MLAHFPFLVNFMDAFSMDWRHSRNDLDCTALLLASHMIANASVTKYGYMRRINRLDSRFEAAAGAKLSILDEVRRNTVCFALIFVFRQYGALFMVGVEVTTAFYNWRSQAKLEIFVGIFADFSFDSPSLLGFLSGISHRFLFLLGFLFFGALTGRPP